MKSREKAMAKLSDARFVEDKRLSGGKAVSLYDLEGKLIRNYASIAACARYIKCYPQNIKDAIKRNDVLMDQYRVSYVKKERPDISKAKRI